MIWYGDFISLKNKIVNFYKYVWGRAVYSTFLRDLYKLRVKLFPWYLPLPSYIEIETTTKCNFRCKMCEHTYWKIPPMDMSFNQFKSVIDQLPTLKWIGMTGIGESFLNKDFIKMLKYVKSKYIWIELFDPFFLIDNAIAKELLDLGIEVMYVSLDGATKETYEKIRVGSNFDSVIKNIKNFIRMKNERNAKYPRLIFHFIISKINMHEIEKYIELVHSFGLENPEILFTPTLHSYKEIEGLYINVPEEVPKSVDKKARELGVKIAWNANVPKVLPPITRCFAWLMPFIFVTGDVSPCCASNEQNERDFQVKNCFGNVFETSFKDIWNGDKFREFRKKILRGEVPPICKSCTIYDTGAKA